MSDRFLPTDAELELIQQRIRDTRGALKFYTYVWLRHADFPQGPALVAIFAIPSEALEYCRRCTKNEVTAGQYFVTSGW